MNNYLASSKKSRTPLNTISTYRRYAPQSARGISGEMDQADTSAPTKRSRARSLRSLKSVGRRGYENVICKSGKTMKKKMKFEHESGEII